MLAFEPNKTTTHVGRVSRRYKGIWICLQILSRAMSGNYVNFGVFELYGDPALKVRAAWVQWWRVGGVCLVHPPWPPPHTWCS